MHPARPALWAAALTALTLLRGPPVARAGAGAVGAGPVVRCEPCDARALAQCAPPPTAPACTELVREPGCGCCLTCALREGDACGVYTERCGTGLRCQPRPAEQYPLKALLNGRGFCANASAAGSLSAYLPSQPAPGKLLAPRGPSALPGTRRGWRGACVLRGLAWLIQVLVARRAQGGEGDPAAIDPLAWFSKCSFLVSCKTLSVKIGRFPRRTSRLPVDGSRSLESRAERGCLDLGCVAQLWT